MENKFLDTILSAFNRLLQSINGLFISIGLGIFIALVVLNFPSIEVGFQGLVTSLARVKNIEVAGLLKLALDEKKVEQIVHTSPFAGLSFDERKMATTDILGDITGLDGKALTRLLNVGLLNNLCEFDNAKAEMLEDVATDSRLKEKGLVDLSRNTKLTRDVLAERKQQEKKDNKKSDIGYPRDCYDMTLTARGANVRTAVIDFLSSGFTTNARANAARAGVYRVAERRE